MAVVTNTSPELFTSAVMELGTHLKSKLLWLTESYGPAQMLEENKGKNYPGVLDFGNNYISLMPNQQLGNFCFAYCNEPYEVVQYARFRKIEAGFSLTFWGDQRSIYPNLTHRASDSFQNDILEALSSFRSANLMGRLEVLTITDNPNLVYGDYFINQSEHQFLMHPFLCCKIKLKLKYGTIVC